MTNKRKFKKMILGVKDTMGSEEFFTEIWND